MYYMLIPHITQSLAAKSFAQGRFKSSAKFDYFQQKYRLVNYVCNITIRHS